MMMMMMLSEWFGSAQLGLHKVSVPCICVTTIKLPKFLVDLVGRDVGLQVSQSTNAWNTV